MNISNITVPTQQDMFIDTGLEIDYNFFILKTINDRIFIFSLISILLHLYFILKYKDTAKILIPTYFLNLIIFILSLNGIIHFLDNTFYLVLGLGILAFSIGGSLILCIPLVYNDIEKILDKLNTMGDSIDK